MIRENQTTLARERDLALRLQAAWAPATLVKLPRRYVLDYAYYNPTPTGRRLAGFVEVKHRTHALSTWKTLWISAAKWREACLWYQASGLPTILAVQFACGGVLIWPKFYDAAPVFCHGGRTDRQDAEDLEPMLILPLDTGLPLTEPTIP